jgi:hypothetical protein
MEQKNECYKIICQICEQFDEDLNSSFCSEIQLHLEKCPQCRAFIESIKDTVDFCQQLYNEDVPPTVDEHLWECLKLEKPDDYSTNY